jgi:serine/threonine-protein phosphatase 4 regulatory subunit 1
VRGTAFQNIGPFIAALKDMKEIDQRIIDFYISTTDNSSNKDVCYYSSFNLPAFIYTLGKEKWDEFRKIYLKLSKFNDSRIKRTLAHSIHELARILGQDITEADLVPIMERFLKDTVNEIKVGALKNLHVFLQEVSPENRIQFIKYIQYVDGVTEAQYEWRMKLVLAQNLGKLAALFDPETVFDRFCPMYFKFCDESVAQVSTGAAPSLIYILEKFTSDVTKLEAIVARVRKNFFESTTFKRR